MSEKVDFIVPGVVSGSAGRACLSFPDSGFSDHDLVLCLFHDNGDGTNQETLFWSRARRAWSAKDGPSVAAGWGPLRDALWDVEHCGRRMWINDDGVEAMEAFFSPDPWSWYLVASVMSS